MNERKDENENEGTEIARRLARQWVRDESIPLALIALEVAEPIELVADRLGDAVQLNDVGMRAVPPEVARKFLTERSEQAVRMEEQSRRLQEAHEPPPSGVGVPAVEDASPFESLVAAGYVTPQQEFGRERPNFLQEELEAGARRLAEAQAAAEKAVSEK